MNKIVFLAVCCALFGIMSPTRAEQQLHLQMFPEVKLNDINDPANFDESWNGETMICFSKGEINPDINEEGQPMGTYEWKSSLPVAGIQPPKGEAPLPIYPDVLHIAPFPLPEGKKWIMISFELIVFYVEGNVAKTDGDAIAFSVLDKKK